MKKSDIKKKFDDLAAKWIKAADQLADQDEFRKDEHDRARETTFRNCAIDLHRLLGELT